jgi:ribokinase
MFAPADVTAALAVLAPGPADVVLVGHEIPTLAAKHALRSARSAGATTVFNPAPATHVDRSVFGFADILTANELELAAILASDGDPGAGAESLLRDRDGVAGVARAVVVTHRAAGAEVVAAGGKPARVPAPDVTAIDAVGAGDTFAGALAAGVLGNLDLTLAVRRAVAAASLSTTKPGARGGMPTSAELEAFLHSA